MKLSIVIPLYNKEKYIDRCLQSLLNQDLSSSEYEIIIVDDGSTDSSCSIARNYTEKHVNIHLFRQKNKGAGGARNRGLEVTKGDYIYFLDADDYIANNVLKTLLDLAYINKLEILVFNSWYAEDGAEPNFSPPKLENNVLKVVDGMAYIIEPGLRNSACLYIFKKSLLVDTGIKFKEGRFMEDSIFSASLILKVRRVSKVKLDVHRYVNVENASTTNTDPTHLLKFIDDLVYAIEEFDVLIKGLNNSHLNYDKVVKVYKKKQQSFVFTLFIKAYRYPHLNFNDLKKILLKLRKLDVYPINPKIGGIGGNMTSLVYTIIVLPIFNNKTLLFLSLRIMRLISSR